MKMLWLVGLLLATATLAGPGPTAKSAPSGTFEDLGWITGSWLGTMGDATIEEAWSPQLGPSMLGTFRMVAGDQVKFYEFMSIEKGAEGPALRIRHFGPRLVAWEDKEGAYVFELETARTGFASFVNRTTSPPERLVYSAQGKKGLVVRLEKSKNGKPSVSEFHFLRR